MNVRQGGGQGDTHHPFRDRGNLQTATAMITHISQPHSIGTSPPFEEGASRSSSPSEVSPNLVGKRIAAVVFSPYPADPRPRRAAEALVREGATVEVICLKDTDAEPVRDSFQGVEITRVPLKRRRGGTLTYLLQYGSFILSAGAILTSRSFRRRYDLVHVHNMPDFLVFSALIPKLLGSRILLDLHDPMPELMMAIFGLPEKSFAVRVLKLLERWSLRFADSVLTVNEAFRKLFSARSCPTAKISVVMNAPDESIFLYRAATRETLIERSASRPFVVMYHGSLVARHGLDLAVTAITKIRESIPQAELRIYGRSTPFLENVLKEAQSAGLGEVVRYFGPKKLEEIREAIGECDLGIIPNRRSVFTELNMPTRIFEYLSQGKPAIAPRTPGIMDYFNSDELMLFELGDAADLAAKIQDAFAHPEKTADVVERGQAVYRAHVWTQERERLIRVVSGLLIPDGSKRARKESSSLSVEVNS